MKRLSNIVLKLNLTCSLKGDAEVSRITMDSRHVNPGDIFVAYPRGLQYIQSAVSAGASAVVVPDEVLLDQVDCGLFLPDYEDSLWQICDELYDHPTQSMKLVGITGTNGKTTTAWILRELLEHLVKQPVAYIGTLGIVLPTGARELANTTPYVVELYNLLVEARDSGVWGVVMEVSSHALAQKRVNGIQFDAGVFTNLTQDHLDFHNNMEEYEAAKWRLFSEFPGIVGCFNLDDPVGLKWSNRFKSKQIPFSTKSRAGGLSGISSKISVGEIQMALSYADTTVEVESKLGGSYNVFNLVSAVAALLALGFSLESIAEVIPFALPVPGRFEAIHNEKGIGVIVDYAHTPDALSKILEAVRPLTGGRLITVFGCGGDRDSTKRPKMALIASELSDVVIATSDNPRTENPESILDDISAGILPSVEYYRITDRIQAIKHGIGLAKPGDCVVIAGKGHENYQIIGREKVYLDDRELARDALAGN